MKTKKTKKAIISAKSAISRSFFVGNGVTEDEVKAKYEDGILRLSIPKKSEPPSVEFKKQIAIEG